MRSIRIGPRKVGDGYPVFIIAEAGVNHNGSLGTALRLVDAAANAGADAIKFQTFRAEDVVLPTLALAKYQRKNMPGSGTLSQIDMLRALELKESWYSKLLMRSRKRGIIFLSTPHGGFASVDVLSKLRIPAYKIASGDLSNTPLISYAAKTRKPLLISTGMATLPEIRAALAAAGSRNNVVLLHATTNYPCPPEEVNLRAITKLRKFGTLVGFSDHTEGSGAALGAVALGACVIEKHLTLDRRMKGPDHSASTEPKQFTAYVRGIRAIERMFGSGKKVIQRGEREARRTTRKSIVSIRAIKKGERFTRENLSIKRPGTGLEPRMLKTVIGKRAKRDIPAHHLILKGHIA